MRDKQTNDEQVKIELLSQWKLEAKSRNKKKLIIVFNTTLISSSKPRIMKKYAR